ncbi:MAG: RNB domain-containing ribonuclease [Nibricoccus sp.]
MPTPSFAVDKRLTYKQAYAFLFENDHREIRALPLPPKHQTGSTGRALSDLTDNELIGSADVGSQTLENRQPPPLRPHGTMAVSIWTCRRPKIFVDEEGYADRLEKIEHDESHQLIEEFMLAANEAVARVTRMHKLPSLYRVHDDPDEDKLDELRQFLGTFGVECGDLSKRERNHQAPQDARDTPARLHASHAAASAV